MNKLRIEAQADRALEVIIEPGPCIFSVEKNHLIEIPLSGNISDLTFSIHSDSLIVWESSSILNLDEVQISPKYMPDW